MPILSELVTRLGFEVDNAGVAAFDKTMDGMKRSLLGIGSILGLSFGAKQLFDLGKAGTQAKAQLEIATAGIDGGFQKATKAIDDARTSMRNMGIDSLLKEGVGEDFATKFFGNTEEITEQKVEQFKTFTKAAGLLAIQTGVDIQSAFDTIMQAASSGSLDALKVLPGITNDLVNKFKFVTDMVAGADPLGTTAMAVNMERVKSALDEMQKGISLPSMGTAVSEIVSARSALSDMGDAFQRLSERAIKALDPIVKRLADMADRFDTVISKSNSFADIIDNLGGKKVVNELVKSQSVGAQTLRMIADPSQERFNEIMRTMITGVNDEARAAVDSILRRASAATGSIATQVPSGGVSFPEAITLKIEVNGKMESVTFADEAQAKAMIGEAAYNAIVMAHGPIEVPKP